ncbi:C-type lectin [Plakobranchus ocellatus]|uniref:C-type lectin n=1 Tax=Plakobranchus ocellatus TaxID=259542 RepID=A0AAV4CEU9_9GAST|nr:C-type lectin [Plakobranchus ocellatus]
MSKTAACLHTYPLMLMVLLIITFAASAKGTASAINLDVSHSTDFTTPSGLIVVNCSVDASLTDMVTVASLTLFGSKPYGNQGEFDELAVVDMWSQSPKLTGDLEDGDVIISGKTGPEHDGHSYLIMSWKSPTPGYRQYYKCVANGLDRQGQGASITTTGKVDLLKEGCCEKMDSIDSQLQEVSEKVDNTCTAKTASALTVQVKNLNSNIGALDSKIDSKIGALNSKIDSKIEALDTKIDSKIEALNSKIGGKIEALDSKIDVKIEALDSKLETFQQNMKLHFKMMAIDKGSFDVSDISKGRVYLASKAQAAFNIGAANQACKSSGGYLVELDDDEEYLFVYDFVTRTGGANSFWTGGNDIEREGQFVYFNSRKPVPILRGWSGGQPDNVGGNEDCMEIRLNFQGLNDWICSATGKFVCEVELY